MVRHEAAEALGAIEGSCTRALYNLRFVTIYTPKSVSVCASAYLTLFRSLGRLRTYSDRIFARFRRGCTTKVPL